MWVPLSPVSAPVTAETDAVRHVLECVVTRRAQSIMLVLLAFHI